MSLENAIAAIRHERERQENKWGTQNHLDEHWLAILAEEFGEVAQIVCKTRIPPVSPEDIIWTARLREELIQVAAVSVAWLEAFERRVYGEKPNELDRKENT